MRKIKRTKLWHKLMLTIMTIIAASQITACGNKQNIPPVTTVTEVQTETSSEIQDTNLYTSKEMQQIEKEEITSISETIEETTVISVKEQIESMQESTEFTSIPVSSSPTEVILETRETTAKEPVEVPITKETQEYAGEISVKVNSASGTETYTENGAAIDASNKASGYIMVKYEGATDKRVKVRITVQLSNTTVPYLYPSQRVNFTASSAAVKKSYDLCVGLTTDEQKVTAIYNFIKDTIAYDTEKASQILLGALTTYVADADNILNIKKGICLDYATLMAVMLRAQNIPVQVIYGTEASNGCNNSRK